MRARTRGARARGARARDARARGARARTRTPSGAVASSTATSERVDGATLGVRATELLQTTPRRFYFVATAIM